MLLHNCFKCRPRRIGLEGIVSKRLGARHRSGLLRDRIKVKNPDSPAMIPAREGDWGAARRTTLAHIARRCTVLGCHGHSGLPN
jgi:hypothetical protein